MLDKICLLFYSVLLRKTFVIHFIKIYNLYPNIYRYYVIILLYLNNIILMANYKGNNFNSVILNVQHFIVYYLH